MAITSQNPATGEVVRVFEEITAEEVETKLTQAQSTFLTWRELSFAERGVLMHKMAEYLRTHKEELATLAALEMGKVKKHGMAEVDKCAMTCDYYAENAEKFLSDEPVATDASEGYVQFDALGPILAVMPWNFPFWQVYRFAAPALMAGNVGLLKHASNVPQCAEAIERAFIECGFPIGAFQNLRIGSARVEGIIRDKRVAAVTLTGSEKAGSEVARVAGEEMKKTVLELGGSDPFIVLADADLAIASEAAVLGRLQFNAGQSCIAAKRFIVDAQIADAFIAQVKERLAGLIIGDPMSDTTTVGPLANEQALKEITRQVDTSVAMGAQIVHGGKRLGDKGCFYEPTLMTNITKGMPVRDEEVFGPIMPVITFTNEDEAITIANDTPYGLGAVICTQNITHAKELASRIESGSVFINGQERSDPRAPFGGVKRSGYGRELSHYGIKEFVNVKNIWIR